MGNYREADLRESPKSPAFHTAVRLLRDRVSRLPKTRKSHMRSPKNVSVGG